MNCILEPPPGFEPGTHTLQKCRSTAELRWHFLILPYLFNFLNIKMSHPVPPSHLAYSFTPAIRNMSIYSFCERVVIRFGSGLCVWDAHFECLYISVKKIYSLVQCARFCTAFMMEGSGRYSQTSKHKTTSAWFFGKFPRSSMLPFRISFRTETSAFFIAKFEYSSPPILKLAFFAFARKYP